MSLPGRTKGVRINLHEETVARLEREVGEALERRDVDTLQRLFADDYMGINPMGVEISKADVLAQVSVRAHHQPDRHAVHGP